MPKNLQLNWHYPLMGGTPLMGILGSHQNILTSDIKQTPSLSIDYISPPLKIVKLIPVNSRVIKSPLKWSLLLEAEHTAAVIKKRLILVTDPDDVS